MDKTLITRIVAHARTAADRLSPGYRALAALAVVGVVVGVHYAVAGGHLPPEAREYTRALVQPALDVLGIAVVAILAHAGGSGPTPPPAPAGDRPTADAAPEELVDTTPEGSAPPPGHPLAAAVVLMMVLALAMPACTARQAEDAGKWAGRAVEHAAQAREVAQDAYLTACRDVGQSSCDVLRMVAARGDAPEGFAAHVEEHCGRVEAACDRAHRGLDMAGDIIREADATLGGGQ